jgi:hypothetical protein
MGAAMGWLDFLRGKARVLGDADRQRELAAKARRFHGGPPPRPWHHFVAHLAIRDLALKEPGIEAILADPARARDLLATALTRMAPRLGLDDAAAAEHAATVEIAGRRFYHDAAGFVVAMPPPAAPTECHFVAAVAAVPGSGGTARYFTLEHAGGGGTYFCEWAGADDRHYFEETPAATLEAFVAAVNEKL